MFFLRSLFTVPSAAERVRLQVKTSKGEMIEGTTEDCRFTLKSNGYGEDLLLSQMAYVKRLTHGTVTRSIPQSNLFEIGLDGGHGRIKVNIMKPRLLRLILPENPASDLRIPVSELEWLRVEEVRWS